MKSYIYISWLAVILAGLAAFAVGCSLQPGASTNTTEPETGTVKANGIEIAYESYGPADAETVLLIIGTGGQLIDWPIELVEELQRRGYRVVRFDNRDAGLSTKMSAAGYPDFAAITAALSEGQPAPLPYRLDDMAADAVSLLDALHIQKAHIVGASMGGAIAQIVAINYPERTLSLTAIMADSGNPALPVSANPALLATIPPMPPEGDLQGFIEYNVKLYQVIGSPAYPKDEQTIRAQAQADVERSYDIPALLRQQMVAYVGHMQGAGGRPASLKTIKAPTVVLHGNSDPLVPLESSREIAANVPGAELIIVPGMGHDLPVQLVEILANAITKAARRAGDSKP